MIWLYLVAFVVMAAGIVLLLGLTPEKITDDLMGIFVPKQNLRDKILIAQGKKRSRKLSPKSSPTSLYTAPHGRLLMRLRTRKTSRKYAQ